MKLKISKTVHKKSSALEDLSKLLAIHPLSQKMVKDVRKHIGLRKLLPYEPTEESMEANREFDFKLHARTDAFRFSDRFQRAQKELLRLLKKGEIDDYQYVNEINDLLKEAPANRLDESIKAMVSKFNLPLNFFESIRVYILNGAMFAPKRNYKLTEDYGASSRPRITMEIYAPLSEAEKVHIFKHVDTLLKKGSQYNLKGHRPYREIDRDIEIYSASLSKNKEGVQDLDLAGSLFPDVEDISSESDKKRRSIIWQSRSRIKKALRRYFPPDTFAGR